MLAPGEAQSLSAQQVVRAGRPGEHMSQLNASALVEFHLGNRAQQPQLALLHPEIVRISGAPDSQSSPAHYGGRTSRSEAAEARTRLRGRQRAHPGPRRRDADTRFSGAFNPTDNMAPRNWRSHAA